MGRLVSTTHASFADITLDLGQVNTWRSAPLGQPQDNVNVQYPAGVLTLARNFGPKVYGAAGVGRFGLNGQFDTSGPNNAQLAEDLVFAGLELRPNGTTGYGRASGVYTLSQDCRRFRAVSRLLSTVPKSSSTSASKHSRRLGRSQTRRIHGT